MFVLAISSNPTRGEGRRLFYHIEWPAKASCPHAGTSKQGHEGSERGRHVNVWEAACPRALRQEHAQLVGEITRKARRLESGK